MLKRSCILTKLHKVDEARTKTLLLLLLAVAFLTLAERKVMASMQRRKHTQRQAVIRECQKHLRTLRGRQPASPRGAACLCG